MAGYFIKSLNGPSAQGNTQLNCNFDFYVSLQFTEYIL